MARDVERAVITLDVNGERRPLLLAVHKTLLEVLREDMQLTGTKHGCELGECGTCTVLVEGRPELSCLLLPIQLEGRAITTIEGMAHGSKLHPLQTAFRSEERRVGKEGRSRGWAGCEKRKSSRWTYGMV